MAAGTRGNPNCKRERRLSKENEGAIDFRQSKSPIEANKADEINPATRTFQALRILVNDELGAIEKALPAAIGLLKDKGRICVISFHSLEDRIVKNVFRDFSRRKEDTMFSILTRKPVTPSDEEKERNPRSRSAKLRAGEVVNG